MGKGHEQKYIGDIRNLHTNVWGDFGGITGDVSGLTGDVSKLKGCVTDVEGEATGQRGQVTVGPKGAKAGERVALRYWSKGWRTVRSRKLRFRKDQMSKEEMERRRQGIRESRLRDEESHLRDEAEGRPPQPHWKDVVFEGAPHDPNPDAHWKSKVGLDD